MSDPLTYMRAERGAWAVDGLGALIDTLPTNLVMAEIGVFAGESTRLFVASGKVQALYAVDPWCAYTDANGWTCPWAWRDIRRAFFAWALETNVVYPVWETSAAAAELFAPAFLDFVYIDACHTYEAVRADIALWTPKVKPGGIIAGHDFSPAFPGVVMAVAQAFGNVQTFPDTSWLHRMASR